MTDEETTNLDLDKAAALAFQVWNYKQGELVSLMIHLGDRLGLYRALEGAGTVTSKELAAKTDLNERWLTEWLRSQAAAGLLDTDDGENFLMTPESAAVLADDQNSLLFAAGAFQGSIPPETIDRLAVAFQTGVGLSYDDLGPSVAHTVERMLGPWSRLALVPKLIPKLAGMEDTLLAGAKVADVGCGTATALIALAEAFPQSTFYGVDPSLHAIELANSRITDSGLSNISVEPIGTQGLPEQPTFDLILSFDCLHDMTNPGEAIHAIRRSLKSSGTWLVKEIRSGSTWEANQKNPMLAMMYSTSVTTCMSSALSEPGGAGLGTLGMHAQLLTEMSKAAGFTTITEHDIGDPANTYYEIS